MQLTKEKDTGFEISVVKSYSPLFKNPFTSQWRILLNPHLGGLCQQVATKVHPCYHLELSSANQRSPQVRLSCVWLHHSGRKMDLVKSARIQGLDYNASYKHCKNIICTMTSFINLHITVISEYQPFILEILPVMIKVLLSSYTCDRKKKQKKT